MRIISGRFRSRKLHTPKDDGTTRPIPDRVKESVFSILRGNCEGASVLDAFAGTGAIGLEALSRGASKVVFIERDKKSFEMLERNIEMLGVEDEVEAVRGDALATVGLNRCPQPVDLVFFDPPYPVVLDPLGWERVKTQLERLVPMLRDDGFIVLRTPWPFRHVEILDEDGKPVSNSERNKFDQYGRPRTDLPPGRKIYHPTKDWTQTTSRPRATKKCRRSKPRKTNSR
jgi:16S rRNA (guanine966-N2)-methyltransferase